MDDEVESMNFKAIQHLTNVIRFAKIIYPLHWICNLHANCNNKMDAVAFKLAKVTRTMQIESECNEFKRTNSKLLALHDLIFLHQTNLKNLINLVNDAMPYYQQLANMVTFAETLLEEDRLRHLNYQSANIPTTYINFIINITSELEHVMHITAQLTVKINESKAVIINGLPAHRQYLGQIFRDEQEIPAHSPTSRPA